MDYQANSNKGKADKVAPKERPKIEAVVVGPVATKKRGVGHKFKTVFAGADAKGVGMYLITDVIIPATRDLIVNATTKGIERMMYGDRAVNRRNVGQQLGSRVIYNTSVSRQEPRTAGRVSPTTQIRQDDPLRQEVEQYILSSREEAENILELMGEIIDNYDIVTLAELKALVGVPSHHVDNKWGWEFMTGSSVLQVREGFLIDLPPAQEV